MLTTAFLFGSAAADPSQPFFDDFHGHTLDSKKWLVAYRQWGGRGANGGVVPENVSLQGGLCRLEAHGDRYRGAVLGVTKKGEKVAHGRRVGACIATRQYFGSGRYEARLKICPRLGACSALWTFHYEEYASGQAGYLGGSQGHKDYLAVNHEIDMEMLGRPSAASKNISFDYARMNTYVSEEKGTFRNVALAKAQNDGAFHLYRFDWHTGSREQKKRVEFYVDGKIVQTIQRHVPDLKSRLWLGVWFPRGWAGKPNFDTDRMQIDWVKFTPFHEAGDRTAPETFADDNWARP